MPKLKLQSRERLVVMAGLGALVLIVAYWASQGPYDAYKNSANQVKQAQMRLQQVQIWQAEVDAARDKERKVRELLQATTGRFDLWTHVDRAVKETKLEGRAELQTDRAAASPSSNMTAVRLTLKGVSTSELVDLLHRIYDNESFVALERLDELKVSAKGQGLDCRMLLVAPRA